MRKLAIILIALAIPMFMAGCGSKKDPNTNNNIKTLVTGYQNSMVTFYSIKNLTDSSQLSAQISADMKKVEDSQNKLEQLSGIKETVTDPKISAELANFIDIGRERERLALKYFDDIRRDLDYRDNNPDVQVDINNYILKIPNNLLDLEYRSEQSSTRLQQLCQ